MLEQRAMATGLSQSAPSETVCSGRQQALEWARSSPKRLLIGGEWVKARSGKTFATIDPSTEQELALVAEADAADIDAAVRAARRAFDSGWPGMSPHARTRVLLQMAEVIERHADELAALESLDVGMPLSRSTPMIAFAVETLRYYAGWPSKIFGNTVPSDAGTFMYTVREPLGVCGLIPAWNFPFIMAATKIANALACGNTVVLKPAVLAPLSTLRLGELLQDTELPAGVLNIVPGFGITAGAALANHPDVDKISFTGSTAVGKEILKASSGNLKKVTLELGGKSPNIIFPDADLEKAVQAAVRTFLSNSGQHCSAGTRVFVHESLHDELAQRIAAVAATYKVGSPFAPDTLVGPLISGKQMERVMGYIERGRSDGARLQCGGTRVGSVGYFVQPTVFSAVPSDATIAREEIFGPVGSIIPFKDEDDAVFKSNASEYGLAAAVWTRDIARAHKVARALKAGRVWINTYGENDPGMPSGGYKQSGYGREFGAESIDAFTQTKAVLLRY
jgi:phenylacetaldehyde dehydrogenase